MGPTWSRPHRPQGDIRAPFCPYGTTCGGSTPLAPYTDAAIACPEPVDPTRHPFIAPCRGGPRVRPPRTKKPRHPDRSKSPLPLLALRARPEDPTRSVSACMPSSPCSSAPRSADRRAPMSNTPISVRDDLRRPHTPGPARPRRNVVPCPQHPPAPHQKAPVILSECKGSLPLLALRARPEDPTRSDAAGNPFRHEPTRHAASAPPTRQDARFPRIPGNLGILNMMY